MQQPLYDLQRWGDIWKWKRELLPFWGKETSPHLDSKRAPNVWKINYFQPVAQLPLKTAVLQDLMRNGDMSVRGNGNQSVGWSRPWLAQGGCTAGLNAWVPTKWLQSAASPRDMGCVLPKAAFQCCEGSCSAMSRQLWPHSTRLFPGGLSGYQFVWASGSSPYSAESLSWDRMQTM